MAIWIQFFKSHWISKKKEKKYLSPLDQIHDFCGFVKSKANKTKQKDEISPDYQTPKNEIHTNLKNKIRMNFVTKAHFGSLNFVDTSLLNRISSLVALPLP